VGELTGELEEYGSGSFIEENVSNGPNNYAYSVLRLGQTVLQVEDAGNNLKLCKFQGL
jgi:hypothetical protein